jgi:hypothetical protein
MSGIKTVALDQTEGESQCHLGVVGEHPKRPVVGMQEAVHPSVIALDLRPRLEFEVCSETISSGAAEQAADTAIFMRGSS